MQHTPWSGSSPWRGIPTHHLEGIKEVNGVQQCSSPSCLGQHWGHDTAPQLAVQPDDLPNVAEEPLGIHLWG